MTFCQISILYFDQIQPTKPQDEINNINYEPERSTCIKRILVLIHVCLGYLKLIYLIQINKPEINKYVKIKLIREKKN